MCSSAPYAPSSRTTTSSGTRLRAADSSSGRLIMIPPSPSKTTTVCSGRATAARLAGAECLQQRLGDGARVADHRLVDRRGVADVRGIELHLDEGSLREEREVRDGEQVEARPEGEDEVALREHLAREVVRE